MITGRRAWRSLGACSMQLMACGCRVHRRGCLHSALLTRILQHTVKAPDLNLEGGAQLGGDHAVDLRQGLPAQRAQLLRSRVPVPAPDRVQQAHKLQVALPEDLHSAACLWMWGSG